MKMKKQLNRKEFIGLGMAFAASGCSTWNGGFPAITAVRSPNGLLRHASIGTANMAGGDIKSLRTHPKIEMAAFCDVDAKYLDRMRKEFPKAHFYRDWRELLENEGDAIDSMNISIPDHNHTIVAAAAMRKGKHIYLQKPLCKSHAEAALLRDLAVRNGVVTQMGAQYTAFMADRQTVELLRTGALGPMERAYFFSTRKGLSRRRRYLPASVPAPAHLDWDLWLGTAAGPRTWTGISGSARRRSARMRPKSTTRSSGACGAISAPAGSATSVATSCPPSGKACRSGRPRRSPLSPRRRRTPRTT